MHLLRELFFIISSPLSLICLILAIALILRQFNFKRLCKACLYSVISLALLTTQPYFADLLLYPLEHEIAYSEALVEFEGTDFIVSPACYYSTVGKVSEISRWSHCSLQRLVQASKLSKELDKPILVTGGNFLHDPNTNYSQKAFDLLLDLGVPRKNLILVAKGIDTASEVESIKSYITKKNVILVTSATHMKRASLLLSEHCNEINIFPVDFHSSGSLAPYLKIPSVSAMRRVEIALYEYGARVKYFLFS
ncbi:MAG: YdcF family protein [Pseudomonadota bacterium]|nr:YdcF family protein [Pseudomonadota bacterium]